jgi:hypothetical protein
MLKKLEGGKEKVDSDESAATGSTGAAQIGARSIEGSSCDADRQLRQAQFRLAKRFENEAAVCP